MVLLNVDWYALCYVTGCYCDSNILICCVDVICELVGVYLFFFVVFCFFFFFIFFFQAEDGIRDLVRSRGLGDVYKRQLPICWDCSMNSAPSAPARLSRPTGAAPTVVHFATGDRPVSYTHLTLPTSDLV